MTDKKKHVDSIHDVEQHEQSFETLEEHLQQTHLRENSILIRSSGEERCDKNFSVSIKHHCNICPLSFEMEDELQQHMIKHIENARPPSIMKKC